MLIRGIGGIGRRVRLRAVWVTPWWFKSTIPHQLKQVKNGLFFVVFILAFIFIDFYKNYLVPLTFKCKIFTINLI